MITAAKIQNFFETHSISPNFFYMFIKVGRRSIPRLPSPPDSLPPACRPEAGLFLLLQPVVYHLARYRSRCRRLGHCPAGEPSSVSQLFALQA